MLTLLPRPELLRETVPEKTLFTLFKVIGAFPEMKLEFPVTCIP